MFKKKKDKQAYKFEYCIENVTSKDTFDAQCALLEQSLIDLQKEDLIIDDDGSPTQFYMYQDEEIFVLYDIELEEIYVTSPIDIAEYILKP